MSAKAGTSLVKRKPKNARSKRALLAREPKVVENPKNSILLRGQSSSNTANAVVSDLHKLRQPLSKCLSKKTDCRPFENNASVEFLCQKNDASLFAMASHTKKRPDNLLLGRTYDGHVLDMLEFGVENFKSMESFKGVEKPMVGSKPCMYFGGSEWEGSEALEVTKSLLLDFFKGVEVKQINLAGLDRIMSFVIMNGKILMRHYRIKYLKGHTMGGERPVRLEECGPSMSLTPRRTAIASGELRKVAVRQPRTTAPVVEKNTSTNVFGETMGRLHMQKQDLEKLQTRKMKGLKRGRNGEDDSDSDSDSDEE
eukprot:TRINITY_DN2308_c0_g1_i3.p1 TRINITY_DN2308_c0_g1~~TRINITY_DN2308_c0_g1_i3.p1  ORF type:complete len:311 (+),score=51.68 TRINITY_DN2308_c0_g1_i3:196-1128(+)